MLPTQFFKKVIKQVTKSFGVVNLKVWAWVDGWMDGW